MYITEEPESRGKYSRSVRWELRPKHVACRVFECLYAINIVLFDGIVVIS
jgi:hypothetical protein